MKGTLAREAAAEFLGTAVLIAFGSAVVAQVQLSGGANGGYISINIAWGIAVTMGVYVAGGVSGAHLNPAVTLALAVHRGFPWRRVAAVLARAAGRRLHGRGGRVPRPTARPSTTSTAACARSRARRRPRASSPPIPQAFLSNVPGGLVDQIVGTGLLLLVLFALGDAKNLAPEPKIAPILVGLLVVLIGMCFGYNAGYAINPARDLGPRLFTAVAGWGADVFRAGNGWWWVPIVGPLAGGVLGGYVYDLLVTRLREPAA